MRILTSAVVDGSRRISWSQPVPVCQCLGQRRGHGHRLFASIQYDKVVSKSVHLVELPRHARRIREHIASSPPQPVEIRRMKVQRAASDVMQSVILSAVIDALEGMKAASKG